MNWRSEEQYCPERESGERWLDGEQRERRDRRVHGSLDCQSGSGGARGSVWRARSGKPAARFPDCLRSVGKRGRRGRGGAGSFSARVPEVCVAARGGEVPSLGEPNRVPTGAQPAAGTPAAAGARYGMARGRNERRRGRSKERRGTRAGATIAKRN